MPVPAIDLHPDGPKCSRIVFGAWRISTWNLSARELLELLHLSADLGITTVDHADIYGDYTCEGLFGAAIRQDPALRTRLQLVSKCGIMLLSEKYPKRTLKHYDTSGAHILESVDNSLRELATDYLDILLLHRPDPFMDVDDTAEALNRLIHSGKVKHVGVSNFSPSQFDLLESRLERDLVTNQIEMSVLCLKAFHDGTLDHCQLLDISPMAWSPMGGGSLFTGQSPQAERVRAALAEVGEQHNAASLDTIALAWLMSHPARIVPVIGTGKAERLKAAAAATDIKLTREQWFRIWTASTGVNVP